MITEQDLQAAIAECQGVRNPNASTCIKLAAYYTIQDKMFPSVPQYSFAKEPPEPVDKITYSGDTEFSRAISQMSFADVLKVMDELMSVLEATNPKLYNAVMRKLES